MIEGLSHITLIVQDVERTATMLCAMFGAEEIYDSDAHNYSISREKFFLIAGIWIAVMEGPALPQRSYNHIAFKIPKDAFDAYAERIQRLGLEVLTPRNRRKGEGQSLYFYDYDNHLFELHTGTLEERLQEYRLGKS